MRVYWTPEARQRLRDIRAYIAQNSPQIAHDVISLLVLRSLQLRALPHSGRRMQEYPGEDLRELLERPYRIIYRVSPDQIEVVTVMHYRQLLPKDSTSLGAH